MAPITINRAPFNALFDDSGQNLDGSEWDKAAISLVLLDQIDGALAKVPVDAGTGKIPDAALSANVALKNAQNIFSAPAGSLNQFLNGLNAGGTSQFSGTLVQTTAPLYVDNGLTIRNVIMNLAAGGCIFPVAQIAQSDPNTFDDYEEGAFTPVDFSGGALVMNANAVYIKVGRMVTIAMSLQWPTVADNRPVVIGSLPFPFDLFGNCFGGAIAFSTVNPPAPGHSYMGNAGQTYFSIYTQGGSAVLNNVYSQKQITLSFTYRTTQ